MELLLVTPPRGEVRGVRQRFCLLFSWDLDSGSSDPFT